MKDEHGKFYFATEEEDTTHLFHTSDIAIRFDSLNIEEPIDDLYKIHFGTAFLVKDTLVLEFSETTASSHDYLKITIKNKHFSSEYIGGYPWINTYKFEKKVLILQKETVVIGDTIKGYLDMTAYKPKYRNLKGFFKIEVVENKWPLSITDFL